MRIKLNIIPGSRKLFDIVYLGRVIGHVDTFDKYWRFIREQKLLSRGLA